MTQETMQLRIAAVKFNGHKIELSENRQGKPIARLFKLMTSGKNKDQYKIQEGFYFPTEQRREEWVKERISDIKRRESNKQKEQELKKEVRANMQHDFKVGQIYYNSWGYDQTNIDFYEVVEAKEKSIVIREIGSEFVPGTQGMDCSNVKPVPGKYVGEPMRKVVQFRIYNGKVSYHVTSKFGSISLYDGGEKGVYSSWYH